MPSSPSTRTRRRSSPVRSGSATRTKGASSASCKECEALPVRPVVPVPGVEYRPVKPRPAPHPGPRCTTHHRKVRSGRSDARKAAYVEKTYSITEAQYQALYVAQGGCCAICRRVKGTRKRLAVDHNHSCCPGKTSCGLCVRGLLCTTCNKFLGHIRDSPDCMKFGQEYLLNPPAIAVLGLTRGET